jgi:tetratricopeptide (TPR) repeat protein
MKNHKLKFRIAFFLTIILTCFSLAGQSQDYSGFSHRVDSLKEALGESTGQDKYNILDQLAYEYVTVVDSIALLFATEAFRMSWQFGDSARIVKSGRLKAMAFDGLEKCDSSIVIARMILPIARRNNYIGEIKRLLNLLGVAYVLKAEYDKALAYHFESVELRKKHEDNVSVSVALNNIGVVYFKIENYVQALDYFEKALTLEDLNGDTSPNLSHNQYVLRLTNISLCHSYLNNLAKAQEYLGKARKQCIADCSGQRLMALHFASGVFHLTDGNMVKASAMFLESLSVARKILDRRFELDNLAYLAELSMRSNKLVEAEKYLLQAEPLFESGITFKAELTQVYEQLSKVYITSGNHQKAALYQSRFIELKEKVYNEQVTINLMNVHAEYLERENKSKIEAQAKVLELSNEAISRQRALNIVVAGVAILSIAFVIVLIQNVRQKKRANGLLEQRVKERTMELELNHNLLLKSFHERDVQFQKMSTEIKSSLATIKGLGVLVSHDVNTINGSNYLAKIEETSNNLIQGLSRVHIHLEGM